MFRKNISIPKQQIGCPACGHRQMESLFAISTICQNCNYGIAIREGVVIHKRPRVRISAPTAKQKTSGPDIKAPVLISPWSRYLPWKRSSKNQTAPIAPELLGKTAQDLTSAKVITCHSCKKAQTMTQGIKESHCIHCGAYINLRDYEIETEWHKRIQTSGNVHIHKHAIVRGVAIECHDLFCEGELHGSIHCTGKLEFHNSSTIIGKIFCQQLVLHSTCYIHSAAAIQTHSALIIGQLHGSLIASGGVTLEKSAILHGDITAANILIRPGAKHIGTIKICAPPSSGSSSMSRED